MTEDRSDIECDLLIAGAGIAGMTAAARASALGLKTLLTGSSSGFYLVSGLFDLLGVYPVTPPNRLDHPQSGVAELKKENLEHPYTKVSYQRILETFDLIKEFLNSTGLHYVSRKNKNFHILTSVGTFKPSFLVPATMAKSSELVKKKSTLLIDFQGFKGYSAAQIASVLNKQGIAAKTLNIELPDFSGDFNTVRLAGELEKTDRLENVAQKIKSHTQGIDLIGLPAVCGIRNSTDLLRRVEEITGKDCFEIPGLPPSIPGLRLKNAFEGNLKNTNNVSLFHNTKAAFRSFRGNCVSMDCSGKNVRMQVNAKNVLLATGRFSGGGLRADRKSLRETVFGIPVVQPDNRKNWHQVNLFHPEGHRVNQAGLLTDKVFRPLDNRGKLIFKRLYAAGSILSANDWIRLKSGAGVSCISACCAVDHIFSNLEHPHV